MIDWSEPVYWLGDNQALLHKTTNGSGDKAFHGFAHPENPAGARFYYNQDGTPFKGAPPISNKPGFDPRQMLIDLPAPGVEAMEALPVWGTW